MLFISSAPIQLASIIKVNEREKTILLKAH